MKTRLLIFSGLLMGLAHLNAFGQCLNASQGQYPSAVFDLPNCDGTTVHNIQPDCYASDYSAVNVTAGNTYTFSSSISTDYITISNPGEQ